MQDPERNDELLDLDPSPEEVTKPTIQEVEQAVCRDLLAIHTQSYGRAADRAHAHLIDDTLIVILDGIELLPNEEFLVKRGYEDAVTSVRTQFQEAIESTFRAAVERATGRRVIGFSSHVDLEELQSVIEIFRLAP